MRSVRTVVAKFVAILAAVLAAVTLALPSGAASAAVAITKAGSNVAPVADSQDPYLWLSYFRHLGGESSLARNTTFEAGIAAHVRYLANHSLLCETNVHDELLSPLGLCPANPYATAAGKAAANNSDITRVSVNTTPRAAITNWFTSAFHALVLLDPKLRTTGYASYYTPNPLSLSNLAWPFTAGVDVYRGRTGTYNGSVLAFPATGAASPLTSYQVGTETPEPFRSTTTSSPCHSWGSLSTVSAPVIVQWPTGMNPSMGGTLRDLTTGANLNTCTLTPNSYPAGSLPREFLAGTNGYTKAAFYYAKAPFLTGHRYSLTVGGTVVTTFNVGNLPSAAGTSVVSRSAAATVNWTGVTAGTGSVKQYITKLFTNGCGGTVVKAAAMSSGSRTVTFTGLAHRTRYYASVIAANTTGAARTSVCRSLVTQ